MYSELIELLSSVIPRDYNFEVWVLVLIVGLMCVDMLTGFSQAVYNKSLKSGIMSKGLLKKFSILCSLIISLPLMMLIGPEVGAPMLLLMYTTEIVNELLSIIENLQRMGVDVKFLQPIYNLLESKVDKKDGDND